jgi:hypothetical protein
MLPSPFNADAARLLSLYHKTEGDTTYMFENKLRALKQRLSTEALEHMERALPRMRQLRRRQRQAASAASAANAASASNASRES